VEKDKQFNQNFGQLTAWGAKRKSVKQFVRIFAGERPENLETEM